MPASKTNEVKLEKHVEEALEEELMYLNKEGEGEEWLRAFRYAAWKGNYVPQAPPGRRFRGSEVYADAHAHEFVNSDTPVVPPQQVQVVQAPAASRRGA